MWSQIILVIFGPVLIVALVAYVIFKVRIHTRARQNRQRRALIERTKNFADFDPPLEPNSSDWDTFVHTRWREMPEDSVMWSATHVRIRKSSEERGLPVTSYIVGKMYPGRYVRQTKNEIREVEKLELISLVKPDEPFAVLHVNKEVKSKKMDDTYGLGQRDMVVKSTRRFEGIAELGTHKGQSQIWEIDWEM